MGWKREWKQTLVNYTGWGFIRSSGQRQVGSSECDTQHLLSTHQWLKYDEITLYRVWFGNRQVIVSLSWVHRGSNRRESAINQSNKGRLCSVQKQKPILSKYVIDLWGRTAMMCRSQERGFILRSPVHERQAHQWAPELWPDQCMTKVWPVGGITTQQAYTCWNISHTHTQRD